MKWQVIIMKTLEQLVNKKFDKKLLDFKSYKKKLDKMRALVKEYNIPCVLKSDSDCFYVEMLYHSLLNKRKFEDVFLIRMFKCLTIGMI